MLGRNTPARFDLDNQTILHEQVSKVLAQNRSVRVIDSQRMLLFDFQAQCAQSTGQRIFINFFQVSVSMITMDRETGFADHVAELVDTVPLHCDFFLVRFFVFFVAIESLT